MANKRLGKGLSALIPDISEEEDKNRNESISDVLVAEISPNPFQPREQFDEDSLEDLKNSIAEKGIIQPITVRKHGVGYQLISGERRLRAVIALEIRHIPVYVLDVESDEEMIEMALIENIQREDLNPVDIANGYLQLMNRCKLTQEHVAKKVGKNRSTITNFLRLLKLPSKILDSLKIGQLDMGHARALLSLENKSDQLVIWQKIINQDLSVRNVENLVKQSKNKTIQTEPGKKQKPFYLTEIEEKIQQKLGTKVNINAGKKGGKIEIEYYSDDELERIIELIEEIS